MLGLNNVGEELDLAWLPIFPMRLVEAKNVDKLKSHPFSSSSLEDILEKFQIGKRLNRSDLTSPYDVILSLKA